MKLKYLLFFSFFLFFFLKADLSFGAVIFDESYTDNVDSAFDFAVGRSSGAGTTARVASGWIASTTATIYSVQAKLGIVGSPTDKLKVKIYQYGTPTSNSTTSLDFNPESGIVVAQSGNPYRLGTSTPASGNNLMDRWTWEFTGGVYLQANRVYYFVFDRTGSYSNTDYFRLVVSKNWSTYRNPFGASFQIGDLTWELGESVHDWENRSLDIYLDDSSSQQSQTIGGLTLATTTLSFTYNQNCVGIFDSGSFLACVENAMYKIAEVLIIPNNYSLAFFNTALNNFQAVFPFNIFFGFQDLVQDELDNQVGQTVTIPQLIGVTPAVTVIGSSTLSSFYGTTVTNNYFAFMQALIWLGVMFTILRIIS